MSKTIQFPNGTDYRRELKKTDAVLMQDMDDLAKEPERTSVQDIKDMFTGGIEAADEGFVKGGDVYEKISGLESALNELGLEGISNLDTVLDWGRLISDLFRTDLPGFNNLSYSCVRVAAYVDDFPAELREYDDAAYVATQRNGVNGVQTLVGARSGYQYTRRLNNCVLTGWTTVQGNGIYYATFEIVPATGELVMNTEPGYFGADFAIENGNLVVII